MGLGTVYIGCHFYVYRYEKNAEIKNKIKVFICDHSEVTIVMGATIVIVIAIIVFTTLGIMFKNYINANAEAAQLHERYNAIVYKIESDSCRDEFGLLNKEIIDEIQKWNENITYYQAKKDNFWIGIVYPDIYDQFQTIDYTEFDMSMNMNYKDIYTD